MCTAATYKTKDFYFGRNLDYDFSYGDEVTITPRNFQFNFRKEKSINSQFAYKRRTNKNAKLVSQKRGVG